MIEVKDVITMKIPIPNMTSPLATSAHMYICSKKSGGSKDFVKCQTYKVKLLGHISEYIVEAPDSNRNPFKKTTLIDCDKIFFSDCTFPSSLVAKSRRDVCESLFSQVTSRISRATRTALNEIEMKTLNPLII